MQSYFLLSSSSRLPEGASLEGDSLKMCDIVSTSLWNEVGFESTESAGAHYSLPGSSIKTSFCSALLVKSRGLTKANHVSFESRRIRCCSSWDRDR